MKIKVLKHYNYKDDGEKWQYFHIQVFNVFGSTHFANNGNYKIINIIKEVLDSLNFFTKVVEYNESKFQENYYLNISNSSIYGYDNIQEVISRLKFILLKISEIYHYDPEEIEIMYEDGADYNGKI